MMRWMANRFLPPACVLCGGTAKHPINLCDACRQGLPSLPYHCQRCGQFLAAPDTLDRLCGACLTAPPPFERLYALFPYTGAVIHLIQGLKFQGALAHGQALGELFVQVSRENWYQQEPLPDLIVPVPLHPKRMAERGFNQALEVARPIRRHLKIPIDYNGLCRTKHTRAQSGLTAAQRRQNIAHAFAAKRNYNGLTVALLDDVVTTGQTISACCHALKKAGAKNIHVWCCARVG